VRPVRPRTLARTLLENRLSRASSPAGRNRDGSSTDRRSRRLESNEPKTSCRRSHIRDLAEARSPAMLPGGCARHRVAKFYSSQNRILPSTRFSSVTVLPHRHRRQLTTRARQLRYFRDRLQSTTSLNVPLTARFPKKPVGRPTAIPLMPASSSPRRSVYRHRANGDCARNYEDHSVSPLAFKRA
jgi:hypothetical protein